MTEHSNYCDYPVHECVLAKEWKQLHKELWYLRAALLDIAGNPTLYGHASKAAQYALDTIPLQAEESHLS